MLGSVGKRLPCALVFCLVAPLVFILRLDTNSLMIWAALFLDSDCTRSEHQLSSNHSVLGSYCPLHGVAEHVHFWKLTQLVDAHCGAGAWDWLLEHWGRGGAFQAEPLLIHC